MRQSLNLVKKSATAVAKYHAIPTADNCNKQVELNAVDIALKCERRNFRQTMHELTVRHNMLKKKRLQLWEKMSEAGPSLKQKKAKRMIAEEAFLQNQKLCLDLESRIKSIKWQIQEAHLRKDRIKVIICHYQKLQKYVERVLDKDNSFDTITQIVHHHSCLMLTKSELTQRFEASKAAFEETKSVFLEYREVKERQHTHLFQRILQCHGKLNRVENEAHKLEETLREMRKKSFSLCVTLGHIRLILGYIYNKICCFEGKELRSENVDVQLRVVARFLKGNFDYLSKQVLYDVQCSKAHNTAQNGTTLHNKT